MTNIRRWLVRALTLALAKVSGSLQRERAKHLAKVVSKEQRLIALQAEVRSLQREIAADRSDLRATSLSIAKAREAEAGRHN